MVLANTNSFHNKFSEWLQLPRLMSPYLFLLRNAQLRYLNFCLPLSCKRKATWSSVKLCGGTIYQSLLLLSSSQCSYVTLSFLSLYPPYPIAWLCLSLSPNLLVPTVLPSTALVLHLVSSLTSFSSCSSSAPLFHFIYLSFCFLPIFSLVLFVFL